MPAFVVVWREPLFGFIHLIQQEKLVRVCSWEDACRVAEIVESAGTEVTIINDADEPV